MQMYGSQLEEAEAELAELKAQVAAQGTLRANQVCLRRSVSGGTTVVPRVPFIPVDGAWGTIEYHLRVMLSFGSGWASVSAPYIYAARSGRVFVPDVARLSCAGDL